MNCPVCKGALRPIDYEGVCIHTCDACGGEFLGSSEMRHVVGTREERFPADLRQELDTQTPTPGLASDEPDRQLCCPSCATEMTLINYCNDTGVHVDRCPSCEGVWLDQEELERIQILVERWADQAPEQIRAIAGDLETARHRAAEQTSATFHGSRFSFVNALINRVLDAA